MRVTRRTPAPDAPEREVRAEGARLGREAGRHARRARPRRASAASGSAGPTSRSTTRGRRGDGNASQRAERAARRATGRGLRAQRRAEPGHPRGIDVAEEAQGHVEGLRPDPAHGVAARARAQRGAIAATARAQLGVELDRDERADRRIASARSTAGSLVTVRRSLRCGRRRPPCRRSSVGPTSSSPSSARRTQSRRDLRRELAVPRAVEREDEAVAVRPVRRASAT